MNGFNGQVFGSRIGSTDSSHCIRCAHLHTGRLDKRECDQLKEERREERKKISRRSEVMTLIWGLHIFVYRTHVWRWLTKKAERVEINVQNEV